MLYLTMGQSGRSTIENKLELFMMISRASNSQVGKRNKVGKVLYVVTTDGYEGWMSGNVSLGGAIRVGVQCVDAVTGQAISTLAIV